MGSAMKVIATVVTAAVISGCVSGQQSLVIRGRPAQVGVPGSIAITDGDEAARCVRVSPGRDVNYSFNSDRQVLFIVAMSRDGQDFLSVSRTNTAFTSGTLIPQEDLTYCFQWKSHTRETVKIDYIIGGY